MIKHITNVYKRVFSNSNKRLETFITFMTVKLKNLKWLTSKNKSIWLKLSRNSYQLQIKWLEFNFCREYYCTVFTSMISVRETVNLNNIDTQLLKHHNISNARVHAIGDIILTHRDTEWERETKRQASTHDIKQLGAQYSPYSPLWWFARSLAVLLRPNYCR